MGLLTALLIIFVGIPFVCWLLVFFGVTNP